MNTYKAYYNYKETTLEASSLYQAKQKAIQFFKVPKSKANLIAIVNTTQNVSSNFNLF
jgi:hypothetical protein